MQALIVLCAVATASAQFIYGGYGVPYAGYGYGLTNAGYGYGLPYAGYRYGLGQAYGYGYPTYGYGLAPAVAAHTIIARDTAAVAEKADDAETATVAVPAVGELKADTTKISVVQKRDAEINVQQKDEEENEKTSVIQTPAKQ